MNTAEKIETIVLCRSSGTYGTFTEYSPGKFRVEADGLCVLVRCGVHGWHVQAAGFEAIDPELYVAARDALEAARGRNCTRHTNLAAELEAWS
jgi:hypothetical protein